MTSHINILLLGETGVGKSTLINGLANYLKYSTLDDALQAGDAIFHIPPAFTLTDDEYAEHRVVIPVGNDDENEIQVAGASATQFPRTYEFDVNNVIVHLIDTPGIGDTRGFPQDTVNVLNILDHISDIDVLHGICILLRPNDSKLTVLFRFCINELLAHLHRDAVQNIVFCFGNSRSTCYRPGDTLPSLRRLLKDNNVNIDLCARTVYCIDNEAIRYLAAVNCPNTQVNFMPNVVALFAESWQQTRNELLRLVRHITSLPAHHVSSTLSVNKARRMILALNLPLADIKSTIHQNLVRIANEREKLSEAIECSNRLRKILYRQDFPLIEKRLVPLMSPYPSVCTSARCVVGVDEDGIGEGKVTRFEYRCCNAATTPLDVFARSVAFGMLNFCHGCGCPWNCHQKIKYKLETIEKKVVDFDVDDQVAEKQLNIEKIKRRMAQLTEESRTLEEEHRQIFDANRRFISFIKTNAIAPYNRTVDEYLVYSLNNGGETDGETTKILKEAHRRSQNEQIVLDSELEKANVNAPVTAHEVMELIRSLYNLPIAGPIVTQVMRSST